MDHDDILEKRLQREAERNRESVETARQRLVELGLAASSERRMCESRLTELSVDVVLVTATMSEHRQLREVAKSLGLPFALQAPAKFP